MAGHSNKKAMTTPIAMTLALMMVVSASTAMYFWFSQLQSQEQGSIDSSQTKLFDALSACVDIPTFDYNTLDNTSNAVLQNCGNAKLRIGDTLITDSATVSSTPCSFILNSTTCDVCPFTLDVGAVQSMIIFWNQTTCAKNIDSGIKHQITMYIDRRATASRSFVPAPYVTCGVALGNQTTLQNDSATASYFAKYNLTLFNNGNAEDKITLTNTTVGTCSSAALYQNLSGTPINQITLAAKATAAFFVNQTTSGGSGHCHATITATSSNCASKTSTLTTVTTFS